ncbi:MAG: hypothetical protein ACRELD_09405 [Longimicrobiales bacterium]
MRQSRACAERRNAAALVLLALVPLAACDVGSVLEIEDPDIITPGSLEGPIGRNTLFAGALGDFSRAYAGGAGGGSFLDGIVTTASYMSDEGIASGTFPTRQEFDQRSVAIDNGTLRVVFHELHRARVALENAAATLGDADPGDGRVGQLLAFAGYAYLGFGENFCSGVPFSQAPPAGELTFGEQATTAQMLQFAIDRFDAAIGQAGVSSEVADLARVGKGRALVGLGQYSEAASAVASVSTDYFFGIEHSINTGRQENGYNAANIETGRISVADREGSNGLDFRSAGDPRIETVLVGKGFDSTTDQYDLLHYPYGYALARNAPTPLASGIEARLIEAEAALNAGDVAGFLAGLNAARAEGGLPPVTDPGAATAREDLLFRERAFWLYASGHRLSDLRRLIRQYGHTEDAVFPTGAYFEGGIYGDDVNLPIPEEEENNPNFRECLDRSA